MRITIQKRIVTIGCRCNNPFLNCYRDINQTTKDMETISHSNVKESKGYVVLFGNIIRGRQKPANESIRKFWRRAVSFSIRNGDVSLYKDGKLIRSCWNANRTILGKGKFKTIYNKY